MTFQELTDWLDVPLTEGDWRQCPIGLGWIHVRAAVAPTAAVEGCVQSRARVGDRAIVGQRSSIDSQAVIGARVVIEGGVTVGIGAVVGDWATLKTGANIGVSAKVGERAIVGRCARLGTGVVIGAEAYVDAGTVWNQSPLYIIGTKFPVFQPRPGFMQTACQSHEFSWWGEHGAEFAKQAGFTPEQISEYLTYLELFKKLGISTTGPVGVK